MDQPTLYTIGHSNHGLETFIDLLNRHQIDVLADVRSSPYSRYVPHFNRESLRAAVTAAKVRYTDLGRELGGRPDGEEFYDSDGHVLYGQLAGSAVFQAGIERLERGVRQFRVAIMCSEEDPRVCHRHLLVGRVIVERGAAVRHIRGDGRLQGYSECDSRDRQLSLFGPAEDAEWKSLRSVLRRKRPSNSSEPFSETESEGSSIYD